MIGGLAKYATLAAALLLAAPASVLASEEGGSGMPQLKIEYFAPQLFWLAIILILFFLAMRGLALPRIGAALETRRQKIDDDLEKATQHSEEADAAQVIYEKALADATADAQALHREAAQEISALAAERRAAVASRLAEDTKAAEARIAAAKQPALASLQDVATEVVQDAVAKLAGIEVSEADAAAAVADALKEAQG
jgi:F-type H+-transporting ATPase subunit b